MSLNRSLVAWQLNFVQILIGVLASMLIQGSAIYAVVVFSCAQTVFTCLAFKDAGARKRQQVFRNFVTGEVLKLLLLIILTLILASLIKVDFFTYILNLTIILLTALIAPLIINK